MTKKNLSHWFDPKYQIDRTSKVIPVHKNGHMKDQEKPELDSSIYELEERIQDYNNFDNKNNLNTEFIEENSQEDDYSQPPSNEDFVASNQQVEDNLSYPNINIATHNSRIQETLEKVIFDHEELISLKNAINELTVGTLKPPQFKRYILDSYVRILEDITSFINFVLDQHICGLKSYNPELLKELKEKDKLLEEFGQKINKIYLNLQKKAIKLIDDSGDL